MRLGRISITALGFVCLSALVVAPLMAQPGRGGQDRGQDRGQGNQRGGVDLQQRFQGFGGAQMGNFGGLMLLMSEQVQEELGLVDSQIDELRALQAEMGTTMREGMRGGGGGAEAIRERMQQMTQEFDERINSVLLPHQQKRFGQIQNQMQVQGQGAAGLARNDRILEELNVTTEQRERMREAAQEAQRELQEKIAALQREAQEKVLRVLTADQRRRYQELLGEPFEVDFARALGQRAQGGDRAAGGAQRGGDRGAGGAQRGGAQRGGDRGAGGAQRGGIQRGGGGVDR